MTKSVRIVRFNEFGDANVLQIKHEDLPQPGPGEVLLRVEAIALNRAEIMVREGRYLWNPNFPAKLGFEAAGIIEAIGPDVDPEWLGVICSSIPNFSPMDYGVYGDVAILPVGSLGIYPASLSFEQGAALWAQYLTAWGGLVYVAKIRPADVVLITAASSSTGIAAIDLVKAEGGISIAVTRTAVKRDELFAQGADHVIVSDEEDLVARVEEITSGAGVQIAYDPIGGPMLALMMDVIAKKGIIVSYGMLSSEPTVLPLFEGFLKYATIKTYDIHEVYDDPSLLATAVGYVTERVKNGQFVPRISTIFPLSNIVEAHKAMEASNHIGKIVVVP
ncbi:zinc-dependent alcohol dehydrogenase family protein [Acetobacter senegalensis]|uniref:NADPH:quinone reductase n=1 Tax=Acetobacter tropicalis TaxID=104102 RepID=A0A252A171_9PROT|nr:MULTISPECIES: zinc-dependent alcohol dehydrogenase family protein [Acetobacter]MCP1197277.1 zinc-dependent alcohol dehydrogenase family protein [Acetobacter senegalensis]OUI80887.1 NADPH:quinone reductase [Acetobacter tropicalis]